MNRQKTEKALVLIDQCLKTNDVLWISDVCEMFDCHKKTARRLIRHLHSMAHEFSFFRVDLITAEGYGAFGVGIRVGMR